MNLVATSLEPLWAVSTNLGVVLDDYGPHRPGRRAGFLHHVLREIRRCRLVIDALGTDWPLPAAESPGSITILEIAEALDGPVKA